MSNRKLNPLKSTLPGPAGKRKNAALPDLNLSSVIPVDLSPMADAAAKVSTEVASMIDQYTKVISHWHVRNPSMSMSIPIHYWGPGWVDPTPLTPQLIEANRVAAEERKAAEELRIAAHKKRHDADEKEARDLHATALDRCTDQTLAKVIELHGVMADWWGSYGSVGCERCDYGEYPCGTMAMISEDLDRRVVTDPLLADGMPSCLLEGGL